MSALEQHLKKVGAVGVSHSPAPIRSTDRTHTNAAKAEFLVALISHVRLHFLYLAEKLQEQLVAPGSDTATAVCGNGQVTTLATNVSIRSDWRHRGDTGQLRPVCTSMCTENGRVW